MIEDRFITMDYGSGGVKTSDLIEEIFVKAFSNAELNELSDGALLKTDGNALAFSTDSFVINPIEFPGGDIGHLCVCGTANDVAMCGAKPKWISLAMVIEEGFEIEKLKRIVSSIKETAYKEGIKIVTGDTKVVEKGKGDGIYINTAGIGEIECPGLSKKNIEEGDVVIVSGPVGNHGTAVMMARNELGIEADIRSDCAPLYSIAKAAWSKGGVRVIRDATRGGVATTLNEFIEDSDLSIELNNDDIPVLPEVKAVCSILGLDPLYCANEGTMLAVVSKDKADDVLHAMKQEKGGEFSAIIGSVKKGNPGCLILRNNLGTGRILMKLTGAQLPRIC